MRKLVFGILLLMTLCSNMVLGQGYRRIEPPRKFSYGVKTGFSLTDMRLTEECYNIYKHSMRFYGIGGAWFQYRSESGVAIRPELTLGGRGSRITCHDVVYSVTSTCLSMRVNLQFHMFISRSSSSIYLVASPAWNASLGGSVHFSSEEIALLDMKMSSSSMNIHDMNVFVGIGFDTPLSLSGRTLEMSGDLGYNFCLTNSFTSDEQSNNVTVLNHLLYSHPNMGSRIFYGIEASVRIGIPFGRTIRIRR